MKVARAQDNDKTGQGVQVFARNIFLRITNMIQRTTGEYSMMTSFVIDFERRRRHREVFQRLLSFWCKDSSSLLEPQEHAKWFLVAYFVIYSAFDSLNLEDRFWSLAGTRNRELQGTS